MCAPQTTVLEEVITAKREAEAMIFKAEVAEQRWLDFFSFEMHPGLPLPCSLMSWKEFLAFVIVNRVVAFHWGSEHSMMCIKMEIGLVTS